MVERELKYYYPPTEAEAMRALKKQAMVALRFHLNPNMTIEDRWREIDDALVPIKCSHRTEKYSLNELKDIALTTNDKRMKNLYDHEFNHARQMEQVLSDMGISAKPEFDVYYCPTLPDMYSSGGAIGLLDMKKDTLNLTREQLIEFDTRLALKMLKSLHNSLGDVYIILGIIGGRVLDRFRKR